MSAKMSSKNAIISIVGFGIFAFSTNSCHPILKNEINAQKFPKMNGKIKKVLMLTKPSAKPD
jgi:hypothetical protein